MIREVLLSADKLSRRIEGVLRLDSVSINLCAGDRVALVGPTGSGKSLLLRSLAMLEPIQSGQLRWHRSPVSNDAATSYRSQVIYLHQRAARFEGTVESVLQLPLQMRIHRQRRFDRTWIIDQLRLVGRDETFLAQPHDQLSGGETQIVALLRAIQLSPQVLLLDEPTSALDPQSVDHVEAMVLRWCDQQPQQRAFIWVSHDGQQSERLCDTVIRMNSGRIEKEIESR